MADTTCVICGNPCRKKYCSDPCRNRRQRAPRPLRSGTGYKQRACEVCEQQYWPTYKDQRTCGRACGTELRRRLGSLPAVQVQKHRASSRIYIRDCLSCDTTFVGRRTAERYCSMQCFGERLERRWRRQFQRRLQQEHPSARLCNCGAPAAELRRKCQPCLDADRRRRRAVERRQGSIPGLVQESYSLVEIAERDGYRCRIPSCGKPVAMAKSVPHPKAPTIDHIIPLSAGGDDTKANVRLAHFLCNSRRGNRGDVEQLKLIG